MYIEYPLDTPQYGFFDLVFPNQNNYDLAYSMTAHW